MRETSDYSENGDDGEQPSASRRLEAKANDIVGASLETTEDDPLHYETMNTFARTIQQIMRGQGQVGERNHKIVWESGTLPPQEMYASEEYTQAEGELVGLKIDYYPTADTIAATEWRVDQADAGARVIAWLQLSHIEKVAGEEWPSTAGTVDYVLAVDPTGNRFTVSEGTDYRSDESHVVINTEWHEPSDSQLQRVTQLLEDFAETE
jgi:hypothetical protein